VGFFSFWKPNVVSWTETYGLDIPTAQQKAKRGSFQGDPSRSPKEIRSLGVFGGAQWRGNVQTPCDWSMVNGLDLNRSNSFPVTQCETKDPAERAFLLGAYFKGNR